MAGDKGAKMKLWEITGPEQQATFPPCSSSPPVSLEYTSGQPESTRTNLDVISKHVRDYMVTQGKWEKYVQPTTQSAPLKHMTT